MLPLIIAPNQILRAKAEVIKLPLQPEIIKMAQDMFVAMAHYKGIGLAAPQVGQSTRLIVIATADSPTAYVNPEILKSSWKKVEMEEGCLSIPKVCGLVKRPERVCVKYVALNGVEYQEWMDGMLARVFQHEVDHINGILFTDRTKIITQAEELLHHYGLR